MALKTVHSLYKEKYAYRDSMSDVVIEDLMLNKKGEKNKHIVTRIKIINNNLPVHTHVHHSFYSFYAPYMVFSILYTSRKTKERIQLRDKIHKIAIYRDHLAV